MSLYVSIRGQGLDRKAHICESIRGLEIQVTRFEAENIIKDLVTFLVGPDSRLPFQVRAMVRREQTKQIKDGAR